MQSLSEDEKRQVLGSVLSDQLRVIQESVKEVPEIKNKLDELDHKLTKACEDIKLVRAAISSITQEVNRHERQIADLQTL
jgi:peptidoglycan hydrolase CwlO-like protein